MDKVCNICEVLKPIVEFKKEVTMKSGRLNQCHDCRKKRKANRVRHVIMVVEKSCNSCAQVKLINEFYKNSDLRDGHVNECKSCNSARGKKYRLAHIEILHKYEKNRAQMPHRKVKYETSPERKKTIQKTSGDYRRKHPDREKAVAKINNSIYLGKLERQPCWVCGSLRVDAHHPAYDQPLNVVWLCRKHHLQLHKEATEYQIC